MADMYECGRHVRKTWREGWEYQLRWLGPFDPSMTAERAADILEFEKLVPDARTQFIRGWNAERDAGG